MTGDSDRQFITNAPSGSSESGGPASLDALLYDYAKDYPEQAARINQLIHNQRRQIDDLDRSLRETRRDLEATRSRYAELYDFAPIGYFTLDQAGLVLEVNLTGAVMLDTEVSRLLNRRFSRYIAGADYAIYQRFIQRLFTLRTPQFCELRLVDRSEFPLDARLEGTLLPRQPGDGGLRCRIAISNIADHKRAQTALATTQHHLHTIISHIPVILFVLDQDGKFTLAVGRALETLRLKAHEITGQSIYNIFSHQPDLLADVRFVLDGNALHTLRQIDGRTFETFYNPIHTDTGQAQGLIAVSADVTEREQALVALRRSEERFNLAVQGANDGIWDWNIITGEAYYSPRCKNLLGYQDDELPNDRQAFIALIHPDDTSAAQATLTGYLDGVIPSYQVEYRARHRSGEYRWIMSRGACIWDEQQRPYRMVGTLTDITDLKRAEHFEHEQRILAEALRDTAAALSSSLDVDEVLNLILSQVERVVPHYFAAVSFISDNQVQTARQRSADGNPPPQIAAPCPIDSVPYLAQMVRSQQPITLDNTRHPNRWKFPRLSRALRAYLGAPIIREGTVIGFIELYSHRGETYTSSHVQRLRIFADQAAIAINNARLHEQAQQYAAIMERQRLARDLHDAINQTLFSASVIAEALPRVIERTPDRAEQLALELNRLTRGALSEMRSLLVELRPESIEKAGLAELLPQLCEAFSARTWSQVTQHIVQTTPLPPDVKEVFYRVAQEALNNIAKHARATDVLLRLSEDSGRMPAGRVELRISDNGRGFDSDQSEASYGFGLAIMRERAESINADFEVRSQPDQGTEVRLVWHFPQQ